MVRVLQTVGQAIAYALFAVVIGFFATRPAYTYLEPGLAVIKLSFSHAGQHVAECRRLSQEELEQIAPNMRQPTQCPRERVPLLVEVELDGELIYSHYPGAIVEYRESLEKYPNPAPVNLTYFKK